MFQSVWSISQDDKGYMWFGTKNGLNRFDGYEFKTYRFNKEDKLIVEFKNFKLASRTLSGIEMVRMIKRQMLYIPLTSAYKSFFG